MGTERDSQAEREGGHLMNDSLAKIAADLRALADKTHGQILEDLAARVEALGLEPSEREVVRSQVIELERILQFLRGTAGIMPIGWLSDSIAALTPIAERKP